jgi:hypothetical protein
VNVGIAKGRRERREGEREKGRGGRESRRGEEVGKSTMRKFLIFFLLRILIATLFPVYMCSATIIKKALVCSAGKMKR